MKADRAAVQPRAAAPAGAACGLPVSATIAAKLTKLGLRNWPDLVLHLPLRYEDETQLHRIADLKQGTPGQAEVTVISSEIQYRPRRQLVCKVEDDSGTLYLRFFNFYPSQLKQLAAGKRVRVLGELRPGFFGDEMVHPKVHSIGADTPLPDTLTPVYPTTTGLAQGMLRQLIQRALEQTDLSDTLDAKTLRDLQLPDYALSVRTLHHPPPQTDMHALQQRTHPAWRRLKFDELLAQQLSMRRAYHARQARRAPSMPASTRKNSLRARLLAALPFALTKAQQRVLQEISLDLARAHPMRRLLQGDVGSGKTIVAAIACAQAIDNGYQAVLMAPTEILAEQHFRKIALLLAPLGVNVTWLIGSLTRKQKREASEQIAAGSAQLIIGTHALIQANVSFHKLGLCVVDEQHRFGVAQRLALHAKGHDAASALEPHQLMMSATPIPRTLSMSYFADLDVSVIDELPPGRSPVLTKLVAENRRAEVIARVRAACGTGAQAYWVCPLIEESDALQLQTALDTLNTIAQTFPDLRVGLVHGRLAQAEKAHVMDAFQRREIQLLVATTVIEVGVDVPNASLMVIENAERMGLAQLHQLRGRVGRGAAQSVCILLYQNPLSEPARARLKIIFEHNDGFEIARHDLMMRGPGEFLGSRQSGVPLLRFADLDADVDLFQAARTLADRLIHKEPETARRHIERWLSAREEFLRA